MTNRKLIVGNWKMNGTGAMLAEVEAVAAANPADADVAICPPFTLIERAARAAAGSRVAVGAQDVHAVPHGPHTGDIGADMLLDAGATLVIVGHSERRNDCGEADDDIRAKAEAAIAAGLTAIVCVGETDTERDEGDADTVVGAQLLGSLPAAPERLVVAYEPVWAIGTGRVPASGDVVAMHAAIRAALHDRYGEAGARVRILYGGSVKPDNAASLLNLPNVDGALVGGASLTAESLLAIVAAAN